MLALSLAFFLLSVAVNAWTFARERRRNRHAAMVRRVLQFPEVQ